MSIEDILSGETSEIETAKNQVVRTLTDLVKQTNGTVLLIKSLTDRHGKLELLQVMSQPEIDLFGLVWQRLEIAAEGTGYVVPELNDYPLE